MLQFTNPIVAGTVLVIPAIQSPGFQAGVKGWRIGADDSAEFDSATLRGSLVEGGTALFYSPSVGAGDLVASIAGQPATDRFGDPYNAGVQSYSPGTVAAGLALGSLFLYEWNGAGWTENASVGNGGLGPSVQFGLAAGNALSIGTPATGLTAIYAPSGDATGATDAAVINALLAAGYAVHLTPGVFIINVPVQVPQGGTLRGAGRAGVDIFSTQTIIRAAVAMAAVVCSAGWLQATNTATQGSIYLTDFKADGNFLATHGVVTQNIDTPVVNVQSGNVSGDAFRMDGVSQSGAVAIAGSGVNSRWVNCLAEDCGRGFATNDPHKIFTDGFAVGCHAATISGSAGISIDNLVGWLIDGCHLYGLSQRGIFGGQCLMTRIVNNYIESWGGTATAGNWCAIDAGFTNGNSDEGSGSVIVGNTLNLLNAPGNAASTCVGIGFGCQGNNTASVAITGNVMRCAPLAGFAAAYPIWIGNAAATSTLIATSTGNDATGHWTAVAVHQTPNGGTITLTTGI